MLVGIKAKASPWGPPDQRRGAAHAGWGSPAASQPAALAIPSPATHPLACQPPAFNYVVEKSHNSAIQGGI